MSSADYWLLVALCPACRRHDHEHCDPDRTDCPTELCVCRREVLIPEQRDAGDS